MLVVLFHKFISDRALLFEIYWDGQLNAGGKMGKCTVFASSEGKRCILDDTWKIDFVSLSQNHVVDAQLYLSVHNIRFCGENNGTYS